MCRYRNKASVYNHVETVPTPEVACQDGAVAERKLANKDIREGKGPVQRAQVQVSHTLLLVSNDQGSR
jgi:hypothetical protein